MVGDALRRVGRFDVGDPELEPATDQWTYRAKLTPTRRGGGGWGFHPYDRPGKTFSLARCEIADERINLVWSGVRSRVAQLVPECAGLAVRLDRESNVHIVVTTEAEPAWRDGPMLHEAAARPGLDATVWWHPEGGGPRVVAGGGARGASRSERAGDPYPPTVFQQVNPAMGDRVRAHVVEQCGSVSGEAVWDLYAGIGETASALAAQGADVVSVEADRRAVRHAARRHGADGHRVDTRARRVEDVIGALPSPAVVVTNPPRSGMGRQVVEVLASGRAQRIVYASCDPATLARDLAGITATGRYRLTGVRAFDLFAQTAHVEAVAVLERG